MNNNLSNINQKTNYTDEPFIEKDRKGLKYFIIITIILLILGGTSFFYYFKIYNNPMVVIGNIINNTKNSLNFSNTNTSDIFKISGELDLDLGFEEESLQKIADVLNNIKLQYSLMMDTHNEYAVLGLNSKYEEKKLLNGKMILAIKNNLSYLYLEDLYDKYFQISLDETDDTGNDLEADIDYEIIVNGLVDALNKSINENDFERVKDKTNINGNIKEVYRNSLIINHDNYERIMKTFITELKNNNEFINEVKKINQDIDINEELNKMLEEIDKEVFNDIIKINFYTKRSLKQELLKLEIVQNSEDENTTISFTPINGNEIIIEIFDNNDSVIRIDVKLNGDTNLLINFSFEEGNNHAKINFNISYEELDKLEKIDTNPSINIDNLTEEEQNKIINNLSNNEALINLIGDISKIFSLSM